MALTPEQSQLLQAYMMKNRVMPQAVQAPQINLPAQASGGVGLASLLSTVGSLFDTPNTPIQGPVQPGQAPLGSGTLPSQLTQFADRIDPSISQQRKILAQQQASPQINKEQVRILLAKAGVI